VGRQARMTALLLGALGVALGHASAAAAGPAQFEPPVRYPAGDGITALAAADFDSNGTVDVLVRDAGGGLTIHPGDGHGALGQVLFVGGPGLARAAPVDGDPIPDLLDVEPLAGELTVEVRIALGDGDFGPVISSPGGVPTAELRDWAPADADGDGRVDLVVATGSPGSDARLWIAPGRGDGSFERWREAGSSPATKGLIVVPDVNGDGRPELVLQDDAGSVWISLSEGEVAFAPPEERDVGSPGSELGPMVVGRFELGGPTTLAVTDQTRRCIALVRLEQETGGAPDCFPAGGHVEGLLAVDLDGDGVTDLVHGTAAPHLGVLYGRLGGLSEPEIYPVPVSDFISGPLVADLDADGKPDVIAVANLRTLAVFRNIGAPLAVITPQTLDFGPQTIGTRSHTRRIFVTNEGRWPLDLHRAAVGGQNAADFRIVRDDCASLLVPFGESCTLRVRFRPRGAGRRRATLVLPDDGSGPGREVQLTGFGSDALPARSLGAGKSPPAV
jgi:hypothetical protein